MNRIREVTGKIINITIGNLADALVLAGLFLFALTIFIFVGAFEGMVTISIILFLVGIVLSYIKSKNLK